MKSKNQLLLASELGRSAFKAGKPCSLVKDKDFKAFLLSCGDRRVGAAPAGEAPTLTLMGAWITSWRKEEALAKLDPIQALGSHAAMQSSPTSQNSYTFEKPPSASHASHHLEFTDDMEIQQNSVCFNPENPSEILRLE